MAHRDYLRGDDRHTINVTLNMIVDNHLKIDTLVADHRVWDVWPNPYRVQMIRRAARGTTAENPVLEFRSNQPGLFGYGTVFRIAAASSPMICWQACM